MSGLARTLSFIVFVKHFEVHVYICDCCLNKVPAISRIPLLCVLNRSSRMAGSHIRPRFTAHKSLHYFTVTQQNLFYTTIPKHGFSKPCQPINHHQRSFAFHGLLNMTQLYDAGYTSDLSLLYINLFFCRWFERGDMRIAWQQKNDLSHCNAPLTQDSLMHWGIFLRNSYNDQTQTWNELQFLCRVTFLVKFGMTAVANLSDELGRERGEILAATHPGPRLWVVWKGLHTLPCWKWGGGVGGRREGKFIESREHVKTKTWAQRTQSRQSLRLKQHSNLLTQKPTDNTELLGLRLIKDLWNSKASEHIQFSCRLRKDKKTFW